MPKVFDAGFVTLQMFQTAPSQFPGYYAVSLSIIRRFTFRAGQELVGHNGKCWNLHGYNYTLEVYLIGQEQDEIDRILDFKQLKLHINGWMDRR